MQARAALRFARLDDAEGQKSRRSTTPRRAEAYAGSGCDAAGDIASGRRTAGTLRTSEARKPHRHGAQALSVCLDRGVAYAQKIIVYDAV